MNFSIQEQVGHGSVEQGEQAQMGNLGEDLVKASTHLI